MQSTDSTLTHLPNGVRLIATRMPHLATSSVSVFVRSGSAHESRALNGVSHFLEHMVFKGTHERDCRRINRDAECLGAEVNAHTDKDHTAFHMRGLAEHAPLFVRMLGDIVLNATLPEAELERERQVLLHELAEDEDDPMATAYKLFDTACWGRHAVAQTIIGTRRNVQRLTRADLVSYRARQYTGANVVVAAAGCIDAQLLAREVEAAFAAMPPGTANVLTRPAWHGGIKTRPLPGSSQVHAVLGFPIPPLPDDDASATVAAALFGEGMSSPLMERLRERRGLLYYAACSADLLDCCGQFVIEASTAPEHLDEAVREVMLLLAEHATAIDSAELERARNQVKVRQLRALERPSQRNEDAALELLVLGRVRSPAEALERINSVSAPAVREAVARLLACPAALAVTGRVRRGTRERLCEIVAMPR